MYAKIIALFALIAVAFAAPKPEPAPQAVFYTGAEYFGSYPAFGAYPGAPVAATYAASPAVLPYSAVYNPTFYVKK